MRIATLQFAPKLGDVEGNIKRANDLLQSGKHISLDGHTRQFGVGIDQLRPDLLVLPELALTGMLPGKSVEDILPAPASTLHFHLVQST